MARNRIGIEAAPEDVFEVLLDPNSYAYWVVGAKEIRSVDPGWPARGAALHHSMGSQEAAVDDRTEIVDVRPPEFLELRAYARPLGIADVKISVHRKETGCEVVIDEKPAPGTKAAKVSALLWPLIYVRNIGSMRRLRRLVRARSVG